MAKPIIIGVSCMYAQDAHGISLMAVRPPYLEAIEAAGAIPLLIHLSENEAVVRALYELCDAILLPGGGDIDPAYFDEAAHPALGEIEPLRDAVELKLVRWTREDAKPLMGICRGLQVINVAFGGSLYQDIPSQVETIFDHQANTRHGRRDVPSHSMRLEPGSWFAEQLETLEIEVNTMHHQSVKQIAPGMQVVGRAPDGVIEAIEGTGAQLVVAIQCHPEHLWQKTDLRWRNMFQGFVAAIQAIQMKASV